MSDEKQFNVKELAEHVALFGRLLRGILADTQRMARLAREKAP